jgi:hypothetical protein
MHSQSFSGLICSCCPSPQNRRGLQEHLQQQQAFKQRMEAIYV